MDADAIAALLGLVPLEGEGGRFRRTWADERSAAIYYLLAEGERSAPHRLAVDEIWHHYAGAPVELVLLHPGGRVGEPRLGADLRAGERPQVVVPAGTWMAARSLGPWTLMGCTTTPPFTSERFTLGDVDALVAGWPDAEDALRRIAGRS